MIKENAYLRKYSNLQLGTHKIGFYCNFYVRGHSFYNVLKIDNHHDKNPNIFDGAARKYVKEKYEENVFSILMSLTFFYLDLYW